MNLIKILFLCFLSYHAHSMSLEDEKKYDELEGVAFIKALVQDKKFSEVIKQYPTVKKDKITELSYLLAFSHYELKQYKEAHKVLEKTGSGNSAFYSLWGNVEYKLKNLSDCRKKFKKIPVGQIVAEDWKIVFACYEKEEALVLALTHKTEDQDFVLESQKMLVAHELKTEASLKRKQYLNICREGDFYLRLYTVTKDKSVLENGHACHPAMAEITSVLVKEFFEAGEFHSIAYLFDSMSIEDRMYFKHAAEFYKVAGRNVVADYFFSLGEEKDFVIARSSYFLGQENYAALLTIPFKPEQMKTNKDLAYALAFSHFKYLSLGESKKLLAGGNSGNQKQLLNMVEQCQKLDWRCRP